MIEGLRQVAERLTKKLLSRSLTISVAESCTGGLVTDVLTDFAGISKSFKLGIVAYSNEAKVAVLGIAGDTISAEGAVSKETAIAMAEAARKIAKTDIGIGITCIAGPSGGSPRKPVGLAFIGVDTTSKKCCREFHFKGTRRKIKEAAAKAALELTLEAIG